MGNSPISRRAFLQISIAGIVGGAAFVTTGCKTTNASDQDSQRALLRKLRAEKKYKEKEIEVGDNYFLPKETSIDAGTIVIWTNKGNFLHDVVPDDDESHDSSHNSSKGETKERSFKSDTLKSGNIHVFLFEEPGTYSYHCHFHGGPNRGQCGSITVKATEQKDETTSTTNIST